jgi:hypothetical protein
MRPYLRVWLVATPLGDFTVHLRVYFYLTLWETHSQRGCFSPIVSIQGEHFMKTIKERLALFFAALEKAQPACSAADALHLVEQVMDAVEDAHSGVPKVENPPLEYQGRLYSHPK